MRTSTLPAIVRGYKEPMQHSHGTKSVVVGASCWFIALASALTQSPWTKVWVLLSASSFAADYGARASIIAVIDRYVATAAAISVIPNAPLWMLALSDGFAAASRYASSPTGWIIAHTIAHICRARRKLHTQLTRIKIISNAAENKRSGINPVLPSITT